eukprot:6195018-Pleurochrysis_carterae.AAC.2
MGTDTDTIVILIKQTCIKEPSISVWLIGASWIKHAVVVTHYMYTYVRYICSYCSVQLFKLGEAGAGRRRK